jgi:hypothetical protein
MDIDPGFPFWVLQYGSVYTQPPSFDPASSSFFPEPALLPPSATFALPQNTKTGKSHHFSKFPAWQPAAPTSTPAVWLSPIASCEFSFSTSPGRERLAARWSKLRHAEYGQRR